MTYPEIVERRLALFGLRSESVVLVLEADLPEYLQVYLRPVPSDTAKYSNGVVYQRCGGGRRVIRKRIGGG